MGKVIRHFCWRQKFVPKGLSSLTLGLYSCIKSLKMCIKSDFKEIFLKLATNGRSDKAFLCWHRNFILMGLSAPALGLCACIKSFKTLCIKSDFKHWMILYFLQKLGEHKFWPKWVVWPCFRFLFYGPSTHFRSFWARSVNLATLFLGKPPRQFTSTQCIFFRQ